MEKHCTLGGLEQTEQDLVICRALVELFNDDYLSSHLAFRGGTALHKLYLSPQPRYSEDIDLVQIDPEPIKETINRITQVLSFISEPVIKQKANNNTLIFRFESEIQPVVPLKLKVEFLGDINILLRIGEQYDPQQAFIVVKKVLLDKL